MNNSLIFTEHCVHPQKPEMEFSLPPPLTDQAQNHLTSPAPSPGLSPQGFSSLHHWQTVDGNAKKGKQKQTNKNFHQLSSLPSIHSLNIISFLNMYKLKYTAHFLSLISQPETLGKKKMKASKLKGKKRKEKSRKTLYGLRETSRKKGKMSMCLSKLVPTPNLGLEYI